MLRCELKIIFERGCVRGRAGLGGIDRCLREFCVANVRTIPGGAELRVLSGDAPMPGAELERAALEEVFLYYFGEKEDGEDAVV